ncbi:MAG: hypothetical protein KDA52_22975, partial [Planctomycetaceae bacterium]|nr:hypothetical protein [Planctomycetaceae bacterium]
MNSIATSLQQCPECTLSGSGQSPAGQLSRLESRRPWWARMVRDRLVRLLDCLDEGQILIHDGDLHQTIGRTSADLQVADLVIH